ncbi:MarR family winged helix-turn-helix transcriptional regulator [Paraferrimonas sp. SM1919]|uniref:MarR family winged helix-turn-helix transcriptional regulator n=1 Tax=Paraferrimonas sp. SM1919 TaxID=2662263 RepID=UPI0013CFC0BB|nr:MarR family winged helix-turn-helix transcriptional regulator [Paraferrimonas sp. SM1919]
MKPSSKPEQLPVAIFHAYKSAFRKLINANERGLNASYAKSIDAIAKNENCSANLLVKLLQRDKAQIARVVKDLIAKGWVTKTPSAHDKRLQILTLTESGLAIAADIAQAKQTLAAAITGNHSKEELATFEKVSQQMIDNLEQL